jgi:molybdenum cofactor cytidylyltransferase
MSDPPFHFGCILLAAGASKRMGQPKQLLPIAGRPLVAHAVAAALASPAWPVVVVLGADAEKIKPALAGLPLLIAQNYEWPEGLASSIRTGLVMLENFSTALDAVLIAPADLPAFSADSIAGLVAALRAGRHSIAAARYAGCIGSPALFARTHFSALHALRGEEGARSLLTAHAEAVVAVDLPELAFDLDTPDDYERFKQSKSL